MTPIVLYPSDGSLKKGAAIGVVNVFFGYQLISRVPDLSALIPYSLIGLGLLLIVQSGMRYLKPKPSFTADSDGFSVMGKKKRSWDEYRGASIHTLRVGFFPAARWVVIKTGKSILGRKVHIKWTHLSSPAADMAAEIDQYANEARRLSNDPMQPVQSKYTVPPVGLAPDQGAPKAARTPEATLAGRSSFAARLSEAGSNPVQSVPTMGERMFGRRKVN